MFNSVVQKHVSMPFRAEEKFEIFHDTGIGCVIKFGKCKLPLFASHHTHVYSFKLGTTNGMCLFVLLLDAKPVLKNMFGEEDSIMCCYAF